MKQAFFTLILFILLFVPCFAQEQIKNKEDRPKIKDPLVLVVKINSNGSIALNGDEQAGATELAERLSDLFSQRQKMGIYSKEMRNKNDVPESERVAKAVWIVASSNVSRDKMAEVINAVKLAGAAPIKMLSEVAYQKYLDEWRSFDQKLVRSRKILQ